MTTRWIARTAPPLVDETHGELPPGLQVHPILTAAAPPNRPLALSLSCAAVLLLSAGSVYLSVLNRRYQLQAMQDSSKTIALLLYEGGDGQPAGPPSSGGGRPLEQPKPLVVDAPIDLGTLATRLDPQEDVPEPMVPLEPPSDRPMELLRLQPGLLPSTNPGHGNGVGSGLGNETGNGLGAGLGQGRGSTWIHSAHGDEELKIAVNFRDVHDYIPPEYPADAVSERISGVVVLRVTTDAKGTPVKWTVLEGHPLLVAATLKVFPRWHFVAPVYKGEKVGATFEVGIRFTLK